MLIKCDKHTKSDLELWEDYEEMDVINFHRRKIYDKEKKAIEIIKNFDGDYVSVSWGKDSTVLAHLCWRAKINIPFVWIIVSDIVNPYCFLVRDYFLNNYKILYEEINIDRWFDGNKKRATGTIEKGFKIVVKKYGRKYISGVRGEESGTRKIVMRKWGTETENTCRPLGWWKIEDIFSYLAYYDLPVHPNYGMLGNGRYKREFLRVASLGIKRGDCFDKEQWEKEYYNNELRRIYESKQNRIN